MPKRMLSQEAIVAEAIELLQEDGVDGLSMRNLALRLKVRAPTLYYHILDKSALLNEITLSLFESCFTRMPPCDTWQEWMRQFGRAIWDVQQEATFAPLLILNTQMDEEHFERSVALAQRELARFEVDQDQLFFVQSAVQAVVTGWSVLAHAPYSEKMTRFVDFRKAALNSVDTLVDAWADRID